MRKKPNILHFCRTIMTWMGQIEKQIKMEWGKHGYPPVHLVDAHQRYRDTLEAARCADMIDAYRLPWKVCINGKWYDASTYERVEPPQDP